jgi:S1-C subfamily serine protease
LFINPAGGDYRVKDNSPALKLGFKHFPMDQFGVQDPKLRAIARKPVMPAMGAPPPATLVSTRDVRTASWLGALVRNVAGLGEVSAGGLPGETGVMVLEVPAGSRAQQAGLRAGDVILKLDGKATETLADLLQLGTAAHGGSKLAVFRQHRDVELEFDGPVW